MWRKESDLNQREPRLADLAGLCITRLCHPCVWCWWQVSNLRTPAYEAGGFATVLHQQCSERDLNPCRNLERVA